MTNERAEAQLSEVGHGSTRASGLADANGIAFGCNTSMRRSKIGKPSTYRHKVEEEGQKNKE